MLLKSLTICCFVLSVQTQIPFYQDYNSDVLYLPDNLPLSLPLSVPSPNELDQNAIRSIFPNEQQKPKKPTTTVEIEKSVVSEVGSTVEQERPYGDKRNNVVNRQISTFPPPTRDTSQQFRPQTQQFFSQNAPNRQPAQQQAFYDRPSAYQAAQQQNKPEISLNRPSVAVPQSELNRPAIQNTGRPSLSQSSQDRPIQNTLKIPVESLSLRPPAPQVQPNRPPSTSDFNYPTEQPAGYNKLLYSVTNFGLNMLKNIDNVHPGNVVISPFSVTVLLGLLQQGAVGKTQAQITNALQMSPDTTPAAYASVSEDIKARNSPNILKVANNVFISENFFINPDFKKAAIDSFGSEVTTVSFAGNGAARQINSWVASRTDNRIEKLISPDAIDYTTQMVLVNAIYFKGLWEVPFRPEATKPKEFRLSNGQVKTAQFMRMRKLFKTGVDKTTNAKVIILPFEREEYQLMIILPSELVGVKNTLASLTDYRLTSYLGFRTMDTELEIPKFTIRADTDLSVILKSMGLTDMFRRDYSDLSGVGAYGPNSPHISSAVHSAMLSIDEKGGTAAAATSFAAVALSYDDPAVQFSVNRPFIAVLWDSKSSVPLFMAKIEDPQQ
ncbi:hypothetical protein PYW07_008952 [Mythimna separata]|uniref:Serpin domain-containing protein n=1 Tax=Mythimna separata TaxID=271217 RepID=A0AAD7YB03_MYTSE|nr:hypothetical protein PYW07_008952 [Mythimna separata]